MAIQIICDGCSTPEIDAKHEKIGNITPGHYCEKCAGKIHEYIAARNVLHDKAAKVWKTGAVKLAKQYQEWSPPDV